MIGGQLSQISSETGGNVGIGFAVPVNTVKEVVSQIKESGKVEHAYLGVQMQEITPELAETVNVPVDEGVMIVGVVEGSPADEAGLQGGEQQVIVEGPELCSWRRHRDQRRRPARDVSWDDLRSMIMEKSPGDSIRLDIQRGQSQRTVNVTLGQQPAQPGG